MECVPKPIQHKTKARKPQPPRAPFCPCLNQNVCMYQNVCESTNLKIRSGSASAPDSPPPSLHCFGDLHLFHRSCLFPSIIKDTIGDTDADGCDDNITTLADTDGCLQLQ